MKKTRVVIPALALIAFSTAASITGTVAWFSANNVVTISGMTVSTKVSSSLLIAGDTIDSTAKKDDANFDSGPLSQTVTGTLEPVSTVNGTSFFYTTEAKANGDAKTDAYTAYTTQADFATAYGKTGDATIKPYVDYVFQLKATNSENAPRALKVTELKLTYGAATDASKAWRVAIFAEDVSAGTATAAAGSLITILRPTGSQNFSEVASAGIKAVNSTTTLDTVTYGTAANINATIAAGATKYYKVVVRLWLEGEDSTCNNETFAVLNNTWDLGMKVELGGENAPVDALAMAVTTPAP